MTAIEVAFETSRRGGSLAVARGEELLFETLCGDRAHASDLLPRLEPLLARLGVQRVDGRLALDHVHVGTGPGSYTGLRIGLATARALAHATGARITGVPSFAALALAALAPGEEGAVVLDARAGHFYHARYLRTGESLEVRIAPEALDLGALLERLEAGGPILGHPELRALAALDSPRMRTDLQPDARSVLALGRRQEAIAEAPEPLYLLPFGVRPR